LLADTLRDFTARTTLIAMLYQSTHDAVKSCQDHIDIVKALEVGNKALAEKLMTEHIGQVQSALRLEASPSDPLAELREALTPLQSTSNTTTSRQARRATSPSTYLGALL
jgi:hypothetical protein